jgi:hypothetical protein
MTGAAPLKLLNFVIRANDSSFQHIESSQGDTLFKSTDFLNNVLLRL